MREPVDGDAFKEAFETAAVNLHAGKLGMAGEGAEGLRVEVEPLSVRRIFRPVAVAGADINRGGCAAVGRYCHEHAGPGEVPGLDPHVGELTAVRTHAVQEVEGAVVVGDPLPLAAVKRGTVDVPVVGREEDAGAAGCQDVVVVEVRDARQWDFREPCPGNIQRPQFSVPVEDQ
ncbi:hypothetical protein D9M72_504800 [compost metagenome]